MLFESSLTTFSIINLFRKYFEQCVLCWIEVRNEEMPRDCKLQIQGDNPIELGESGV